MNSDGKPIVEVVVRVAYGVERIYPKNAPAKALSQLAGVSTFSTKQLELIRDLGFEIVDCTPAPSILDRFKVAKESA